MRSADVTLAEHVADRLDELAPAGARCLVAVSGGPDSLALLDLLHLAAARHRRPLIVGHIDHGIHAESSLVADRVVAAAAARDLPFCRRQLHLGAATSETRARVARRAALAAIAADVGAAVIVLAHHADDQAETVLLRLLRGSGPAGLAGMAPRQGRWVRPLLDIRRSRLAEHLLARGLQGWADPANDDPRHLRSWLRRDIVPALSERLPDVIDRINRSANQAAEARAAWGQVPEQLTGLDLRRTRRGISVAAPVLQGYRSALRHAVLAAFGRQMGVPLGARRLAALDQLLDGTAVGGAVSLAAGMQAELAFGRLTLYQPEAGAAEPVALLPGPEMRVGGATFHVTVARAEASRRDGLRASLVPARYAARPWRPGDRIRPLGGAGSRPVSVLLREAQVPPARRREWPVIVAGDDATIVWVPGICRSDAAVPAEETEAWIVECAFT